MLEKKRGAPSIVARVSSVITKKAQVFAGDAIIY